jgi:RNA polymerase sigma-70 factor (ECF subfamily)
MEQNPDEQQLLEDLKNGSDVESQKAFTAIYRQHHKTMRGMAIYQLGNTHEAEDVVQEVFTSLWNRRKEIVITTSLKNYFFISIKNKAMDVKKSKHHYDKYAKVQTDTQLTDVPPSKKMENDESKKWILSMLEDASLKIYREPLKLRYLDDLTYKEIAEKLGISVSVTRTYVSRAIMIIRKKYPDFPLNLLCFIFTIDFIISL